MHLQPDREVRSFPRYHALDTLRGWMMLLGVALFCVVYFAPPLPDAVDPQGQRFALSHEGKAALALFFLAATWWVFEVIPIGVTGITIGVVQVLFLIRPEPRVIFGNFMDPSVWFIVGSITFGMVFSKTGLTKRMALGQQPVSFGVSKPLSKPNSKPRPHPVVRDLMLKRNERAWRSSDRHAFFLLEVGPRKSPAPSKCRGLGAVLGIGLRHCAWIIDWGTSLCQSL